MSVGGETVVPHHSHVPQSLSCVLPEWHQGNQRNHGRSTLSARGQDDGGISIVAPARFARRPRGAGRAQIGLGGLPLADTARSIELLATEVLPVIRRETCPSSKEVA